MKKINVYDFDKTLYSKDCSVQFYLYCLKKNPFIIRFVPGIIFYYILYFFKLIEKEKLKEYYFKFLCELKDCEKIVRDFWNINKKYIRSEFLNMDNEIVVISASPEFLIKDICIEFDVDVVIATNVDIKTGKFISNNCYGSEKLVRLNEIYDDYVIDNFYSDSYSDEVLAKISKNAYFIKKGKLSKWIFKN